MKQTHTFRYQLLTWLVFVVQILVLVSTAAATTIQPMPQMAQTVAQQAGFSDWLAQRAGDLATWAQPLWGTVPTAAAQALVPPQAPASNSAASTAGEGQRVARGETPAGLTATEWGSIQKQMAVGKYRLYADPTSAGYRSANPAHGLQIAYDQAGVTTLTPRAKTTADWRVSFHLQGVGYQYLTPFAQPPALVAPPHCH